LTVLEIVPFSVALLYVHDSVEVVVIGELDSATAPEVQGVLIRALGSGVSDLVVDLAACGFIDCAGLSVLVDAAGQAHSRGGTITLRRPSLQVCRVRALLGLDSVLPTRADEILALV
jgi:anti-anti-sigma factor